MAYLLVLLASAVAHASWTQTGCRPNLPIDKKGTVISVTDSCGKPAQVCYIPMSCLSVETEYLTNHGGAANLKSAPPPGYSIVTQTGAICKAVDGGCPPLDECRVNAHDVTAKWDEKPTNEVFPPGPGDENGVVQ